MKNTFIALLTLFMASCVQQNESQSSEVRGDYKVELLFEKDGCKVYRFNDGRTVYYTDCTGRLEYSYQQRNSKTTTTHYVENTTN